MWNARAELADPLFLPIEPIVSLMAFLFSSTSSLLKVQKDDIHLLQAISFFHDLLRVQVKDIVDFNL